MRTMGNAPRRKCCHVVPLVKCDVTCTSRVDDVPLRGILRVDDVPLRDTFGFDVPDRDIDISSRDTLEFCRRGRRPSHLHESLAETEVPGRDGRANR